MSLGADPDDGYAWFSNIYVNTVYSRILDCKKNVYSSSGQREIKFEIL